MKFEPTLMAVWREDVNAIQSGSTTKKELNKRGHTASERAQTVAETHQNKIQPRSWKT
jgi:hypothetical protein